METNKSLVGRTPFREYSLIKANRSSTISSSNYSSERDIVLCNPLNPETKSFLIAEANFDINIFKQ